MDAKEIEKLAQLARIELSDNEKKSLLQDFEKIISFVGQVKEVVTDDKAEERVGNLYNAMREDGEPHKSGTHSGALLGVAPNSERKYVKVKKIL